MKPPYQRRKSKEPEKKVIISAQAAEIEDAEKKEHREKLNGMVDDLLYNRVAEILRNPLP